MALFIGAFAILFNIQGLIMEQPELDGIMPILSSPPTLCLEPKALAAAALELDVQKLVEKRRAKEAKVQAQAKAIPRKKSEETMTDSPDSRTALPRSGGSTPKMNTPVGSPSTVVEFIRELAGNARDSAAHEGGIRPDRKMDPDPKLLDSPLLAIQHRLRPILQKIAQTMAKSEKGSEVPPVSPLGKRRSDADGECTSPNSEKKSRPEGVREEGIDIKLRRSPLHPRSRPQSPRKTRSPQSPRIRHFSPEWT